MKLGQPPQRHHHHQHNYESRDTQYWSWLQASKWLMCGADAATGGDDAGVGVDVAAAGTADGTLVQQYDCNASGAQTWNMKVITWAPLEVELVAAHSGKCLDVDMGIGPKVHQWWCTGGGAQRFVLNKR